MTHLEIQKMTAEGAKKKGCKLPANNYNEFIEIFK